MEIIYKGTLYQVPITSPTEIDDARLYNLSTGVVVDLDLKGGTQNANGMYEYELEATPAESGNIPVGIYNLELVSIGASGEPIIVACYENYAKVKESSWQHQS